MSSIRFAWLSLTPCTESQRWRERERVFCFPTWFWLEFMVLVFFFLFNLFSKSFPLLLIYLPHLLMHLPWCLFFLVSLSLFVSQDFRYKPLIFLEKIVPLRTCMLDPRFAAFLITIFHDVFHQRILHFLPQIWPSYELFPFRFFIF